MDAQTVDPRVIAEALQMDTLDLARVLTKWAGEALPKLDFAARFEPPDLGRFEDAVTVARRYLESAHAAMAAWNEDNPPELDDANE